MARRFQYKALTFVPLVEASVETFVPVFSQSTAHIVVPVRFQYQSHFRDLTVQQAGETITLDKWIQNTLNPRLRKNNNHLSPSFFADLTILVPKADGWLQRISVPIFRKKPLSHLAPSFFFDPSPLPPAEIITVDKWFVRSEVPNKQKRNQYLYPNFFTDVALPTPPTVDKWFQAPQIPVKKPKASNGGGFFYVRVDDAAASTDIFVYSQGAVHMVVPVRFQYQSHFRDLTVPSVGGETVTVDKWFQPTQTPLNKKKNLKHLDTNIASPLYLIIPQVLSDISQPLNKKPSRKHLYTQITIPLGFTATVTLQDILGAISQPLNRKAQRGHLNTPFTTPVQFTIPGILFTVSQPLNRKKQLQHLNQFFFSGVTVPENITLDKWFGSNNQPYFRRVKTAHLHPVWTADKYLLLGYAGIILGRDNDTNTGIGRRILGNIGRDNDTGIGIGRGGQINIGWDRDTNTGIGKKLP